jgi:hypothetical protein
MATGAKLPTSLRTDDGRFHGGAKITLVEGVRHPNPPPPPAHLTRREAALRERGRGRLGLLKLRRQPRPPRNP